MRLFVSWSGERSQALATALHGWLPLVLHFAEPWLSKSDIEAGERWGIEVAKELEQANFGILCVTRDNLSSPWILFEAGALAKSMQDGRVIPLLLDLDFKEISGPLAQFQAKKADRDGIRELVSSLNKASQAPVPDSQLEKLFSALWDDIRKQIEAIPASGTPAKHTRPQGEILEELVSSVRNVEMRVRDVVDDDPSFRRRRRMRHPEMLIDVAEHMAPPGDPVRLLVIAGQLREEAPWLYELAHETYQAVRDRDSKGIHENGRRLISALEMMRGGPFIEDRFSDRAVHYLTREVIRVIESLEPDLDPDKNDDIARTSLRGPNTIGRRPTAVVATSAKGGPTVKKSGP